MNDNNKLQTHEDTMILQFTKGNSLMGDFEILNKFSTHRKNIVEIGTAYGISTMMLLTCCDGNITTIDNHEYYRNTDSEEVLYTQEGKAKIIQEYLTLFSRGRIKSIHNDSVKEAENWEDENIDLLFIDGGHEYEQVKADYFAWYPKVQNGSAIIFHDVTPNCQGVWTFWNKIILKEIKMKRIKELIQESKFKTICKVVVKQ